MGSADAGHAWLADLGEAAAYPDDPSAAAGVRRVDTHISHVFLTGTRAYKVRRPVSLAFLDFSRPAERVADCLREVALNRRLAPDVYLGVAPVVRGADGRVRVGPTREEPSTDPDVLEHCVVMRRLPAGRDLRSMIERGDAKPGHVDRVAARLAAFHAAHSLGRPAPMPAQDWLARTTAPARQNFDALRHVPPHLAPPAEVEEVRRLAERFAASRRAAFEARREAGRVVDGHGDLHAEHVWFETDDAEPLMVDCLEFRDDFRVIDAASDVAFLAMDLAYRGRRDLAARFLRRYARDSGDWQLFEVVDYFLAYRALVRAKVASLVATDQSMGEAQRAHAVRSVRGHLDLALDFLRERPPGALVLVTGTIGSGKTTVAEALADRTGGVVLSSDRLRRQEAGAGQALPTGRNDAWGVSRYSDASRGAVYGRLLAEARAVVESGRTAILDATYGRRTWRDEAAAWGREHAGTCLLVEVTAAEGDVRARLAAREAAGNDASEAGPALYDAMVAEYEAPVEWPAAARGSVDTSDARWRDAVDAIAARLR